MKTTCFIVYWVPKSLVLRSAEAAGWVEGGEKSIFDLLDPNLIQSAIEFLSLKDAVHWAKIYALEDFFGAVRVERKELQQAHDDLGNLVEGSDWVTVHVWEVDGSGSINDFAEAA